MFHLALDGGVVGTFDTQWECDIFVNAHMRIERIALEHHRDAALDRRQVVDALFIDDDIARCRILKARDHTQKCGLAAARWSDKDHELAFVHFKGYVLDDVKLAEALDNILEG